MHALASKLLLACIIPILFRAGPTKNPPHGPALGLPLGDERRTRTRSARDGGRPPCDRIFLVSLTHQEFEALLADGSKRVEGNLDWAEDEDHSPSVEFRAEVKSDAGYPLFVRASYNALARTASFALIHRGVGRIYALDLGKDHHNPSCQNVGEKHKHRYTEQCRDKEAYVPSDITAAVDDPVAVWKQFCAEALIAHNGTLYPPPPRGCPGLC